MPRPALFVSLALHAGVLAWGAHTWSHRLSVSSEPRADASWSPDAAAGFLLSTTPVEPAAEPPSAPQLTPPVFVAEPAVPEIEQLPLSPAPPIVTTSPVARSETRSASPVSRPKARGHAASPTKAGGEHASTGLAGPSGAGGGGGSTGYAPPRFLVRYKPLYPPSAHAAHREGTVLVLVSVNTEGRVTRANLSHSSGYAVLDRAAMEAVRSWRFEPARQRGLAIEAEVELPVSFRLVQ